MKKKEKKKPGKGKKIARWSIAVAVFGVLVSVVDVVVVVAVLHPLVVAVRAVDVRLLGHGESSGM